MPLLAISLWLLIMSTQAKNRKTSRAVLSTGGILFLFYIASLFIPMIAIE